MPDHSGPQCRDKKEKYCPTILVAMDLCGMKSRLQLLLIWLTVACVPLGLGFGLLVRFSSA